VPDAGRRRGDRPAGGPGQTTSDGTATAPLWLRAAPFVFLLLWSGGYSVAKIGLRHAEPMTLLALRYGLALVLLLPVALVQRPPPPRRRADWGHLAVVGFLIQVVYFGLCYIAMKQGTSAGNVALIVSLQPILVALLAPRLGGEPVGGAGWAGLGLGLAGAALVIASRSTLAAGSPLGLLAAAGALAGMTAASLYEKRFGGGQHPVTANLVQYVVGFVVLLPWAVATERLQVDWTLGLIGALAYLVIGNSLISTTLLLAMIRRGEVARVSALFFLVPPAAALIAWAVLDEAMTGLAWIGLVLAALGVALASRRRTARAAGHGLRALRQGRD